MRLPFSYGLPILRRDFCLRRILAVRIWFYLLLLYRMCNRIQGRTPVFWVCHLFSPSLFLKWTNCGHWYWLWPIRCLFLRWVMFLSEDPLDLGFWNGPFVIPWFVGFFWIWCWGIIRLFGFWSGFLKCSWLTLNWIVVIVRTFSCWSDFNMRASVKHDLLGHGFHDELFN